MKHIPVLLNEVIGVLNPAPGETFFDGTYGGGGHASEIIRRIAPNGTFIGIDRDPERVASALQATGNIRSSDGVKIFLKQGNYADAGEISRSCGAGKARGMLLDLGFSSFQVDSPERGFSFQSDGPLDMRYARSEGISAEEVVNSFSADALTDIFRRYGDERRARTIAEEIVTRRRKARICKTTELACIIESVKGGRKERGLNPATKVFQALRIYVNDELGNLERFLASFPSWMEIGGRVAVISFHALEDRLVKTRFRELVRSGKALAITKKPIMPWQQEIRANPRARSAKLRGITLL